MLRPPRPVSRQPPPPRRTTSSGTTPPLAIRPADPHRFHVRNFSTSPGGSAAAPRPVQPGLLSESSRQALPCLRFQEILPEHLTQSVMERVVSTAIGNVRPVRCGRSRQPARVQRPLRRPGTVNNSSGVCPCPGPRSGRWCADTATRSSSLRPARLSLLQSSSLAFSALTTPHTTTCTDE